MIVTGGFQVKPSQDQISIAFHPPTPIVTAKFEALRALRCAIVREVWRKLPRSSGIAAVVLGDGCYASVGHQKDFPVFYFRFNGFDFGHETGSPRAQRTTSQSSSPVLDDSHEFHRFQPNCCNGAGSGDKQLFSGSPTSSGNSEIVSATRITPSNFSGGTVLPLLLLSCRCCFCRH